MNENNAKRIFYEDSREKKRTAIGIHNRASRRGYIKGGIRTAYDFMTAKERKKLNGEVKVYNMYDNYKDIKNCNLDEILKKNDNDIKNILTIVKSNNTCSVICKRFNISNGKLYNLYKKYGVTYNVGGSNHISKKGAPNINLAEVLIPKEKFKLMDTIQKGEYIRNITDKYKISLSKIAEFMNTTKASIAYYIQAYDKKKNTIKNIQPMYKNLIQIESNKQKTFDVEQQEEIVKGNIEKNNIKNIDDIKENNEIIEIEQMKEEPEIEVTEQNNTLIKSEKIKEQNEERLKEKIAELENTNSNLAEKNKELTNRLSALADNLTTTFKIELNGEYTKEDLSGRLLSLSNMMIDNNTYKVKIVLEEI